MKVKRLLLALGLMIASGMMVLNAKNVVHEGTFKGGTWAIYDDGELRIARSGDGAIPNYEDSQAPWATYSEEVKWIYLDESKGKITRIGKWAFRNMEVDSIKQGNRPANHLQLETLGKKALNAFNVRDGLYITGNKEMSRHTAINSTPVLGFKNLETVWEYGLSGDHHMIDLGPNIKMLKAGSLACQTLWHNDGSPSVFMQSTTPPEWQRIVNQGESHVWENIVYATISMATGGLFYVLTMNWAMTKYDVNDAHGGYGYGYAASTGANPFIQESEYEYPFGDKPKYMDDGEVIVVVPPTLLEKYRTFYKKEHPETHDGYMTAYYYGKHSKKTSQNATACGRIVAGEPLYDANENLEGWWYMEKDWDNNDEEYTILHVGFFKEIPSYSANSAPWMAYATNVRKVYLHTAGSIAEGAFADGKNLAGASEVYVDYSITEINDRAFYNCKNITGVYEFNGNPHITAGNKVFYGCTNLADIYDIMFYSYGESCFENCSKIYGINQNVYSVPKRAFYGCTKLYNVNLSRVTSIGEEAFSKTGIREVVLLRNCQIDTDAFRYCNSLFDIHFGAGEKKLGAHAFYDCPSLKRIFVDAANYNEVIANADAYTFRTAGELGYIVLHIDPDYYEPYETHPVYKQMQVSKDFHFPVTGNMHGGYLHWELGSDGTFTITPTLYNGSAWNQYYYIPDYDKVEDQPWYQYREYIRTIELQTVSNSTGTYGIKKIGKNAFAFPKKGESNLRTVRIPKGCQEIHEAAFRNNDRLDSVYMEDVQKIDGFAFDSCSQLCYVKMGNALVNAGDYLFRGCKKLNTILLQAEQPAEATQYSFANIDGTTGTESQKNVTLNVPEGALNNYLVANYWNQFKFPYADNTHGQLKASGKFGDGVWILYEDSTMIISANRDLTSKENTSFGKTVPQTTKSIIFQGNLTSVGRERAYMFTGFDNLEYVSLPSNVKRIGANCFEDCAKLSEVTLGSVDTIDAHAFAGCGFEAVSLASAKVVGGYAFEKCKQLTTVTVGSDAQLGLAIFRGCTALQTVDLGSGKLGNNMFWDCLNLSEVTYSGAELPSGVFDGCVNLNIVHLGAQLNKIGAGAFNKCDGLDTIYINTPTPSIMEETEQINDYAVVDDDLMSYSANRANPFGVVITGSKDEIIRWGYYIDHTKIHVVVPSLYESKYKASKFWKDMKINSPTEDNVEFPVNFNLGQKGSGIIDKQGNLKTVVYGEMTDKAENILAGWDTYISDKIEFDYNTRSVAKNAFSWMSAEKRQAAIAARVRRTATGRHAEQQIEDALNTPMTITFGALMKTIEEGAFYNDLFDPSTIFYSYAATPPTIYAKAFNWDVLTANSKKPTLHVLNNAEVVNAYKNAPGWYRFNIVGDLEKQKAPSQYTVTFVDGTSQGDVPVVIDEQVVDLGMSAVAPKAPNHIGYIFSGWEGNYSNVTQDELVIAQYTYTTHKVNFYAYGQEIWESQTVEHGAAAQKPAKTPEGKGNIIFDHWGWSSNMDSVIRDLNCNAMFKQNVPVTKIDIEPNLKPYTINKSELGTKTVQLTATVLPTNALNKDIVWSTEKEEVATVDQDGLVTFQGFGECYIYATAADGSGVSDYVWVILYDEDEVIEPVYATDLNLEQKEVTITLNQDPKLVYFTVTPADYNGGISFIPKGEMHTQIMQISSEGQNAPGVYINADEFLKQKQNFTGWTDTIDFRADMFDPQVTQHAPQVRMIIHIIPDSIFTENSIEGVPVTYHVTDLENKTCEVYGYMKQLMQPDPETGLPFTNIPAIPVTTTGKVTIPGSVRGFNVLRTHENAFIGCEQLEEVEFENGFQQFGASSLAGCNSLKTILLPKSLKKIEPFCATGLQNVTNVYIRAAEPPIGWQRMIYENEVIDLSETHAFENANANAVLHVIKGSKAAYNVAPWTEWFKTVTDDLDGAYTVRFMDYDGTELSNQSVEHGENAIAPVDPFHSGRQFTGWDKSFTHVVSNLTITAQYNVTKFTVTFVNWNGTNLQETQVEYGESVTAPADPIRNGYVFKGWDKKFDYIIENTTITAVYTKLYTVSFIDWDGTELKSESVEEGQSAHEPNVPLRAGYNFEGWDTDFDYVTSNLIVIAQYEKKESTGIEDIVVDTPQTRKVIINGQLYILRNDGAIYNATGMRVK